jgi:hypothetical protein
MPAPPPDRQRKGPPRHHNAGGPIDNSPAHETYPDAALSGKKNFPYLAALTVRGRW